MIDDIGIGDMLIAVNRHSSKELWLDKLRANRNIINEDGFRERMKKAGKVWKRTNADDN